MAGEELSQYLIEAQFVDADIKKPSAPAEWQDVTLPHFTPLANPEPRVTWYRIPVERPAELQYKAVYLWRFSMNAQVWLNDDFIGGMGSMVDPITRNWNRPFLYAIPQSAWQESSNALYVRLAAYPGWGYLAPPIIDDIQVLEPEYRSRFFWQITTNQITSILSLVAGLIALTFWLTDRGQHHYGVFALSCFAWAVFSVSNYIQATPISAKMWWWMVHVSIDAYAVLLALFLRRLMKLKFNFWDIGLLGFLALSAVIFAVFELVQIAELNSYVHLMALLISIGLMFASVWFCYRQPKIELLAFAACMIVVVIFSVHDWLMIAIEPIELWRTQGFWLQFSAPLMTIVMIVILSRQFASNLRLQLDLEQQIRIERDRIYSDIHDDIGSKLLTLVYSAESEQQAEIAREALRDTRAIVSGAMAIGTSLEEVLSSVRAESELRCELVSTHLTWMLDDVSSVETSEIFLYHLQRILRELISNSLKHSSPDKIDVYCRVEGDVLKVDVSDDGQQQSSEEFEQGTGVSGVKRRARELEGSADWHFSNNGCRVEICLPLNATGRES